VQPSGSAQPVLVTVTLGGDVQKDILMQGSASQKTQWYGSTSYASPAQVPAFGSWAGALSGYGMADFLQFQAQANRTLSVSVNALDGVGNASEAKALPVIGMWALAIACAGKHTFSLQRFVRWRDPAGCANSAEHGVPIGNRRLPRRWPS